MTARRPNLDSQTFALCVVNDSYLMFALSCFYLSNLMVNRKQPDPRVKVYRAPIQYRSFKLTYPSSSLGVRPLWAGCLLSRHPGHDNFSRCRMMNA